MTVRRWSCGGRRARADVLALLGLVLATGCTRSVDPLVELGQPGSVRVEVPEADRGSEGERLPFALDEHPVKVDLEVRDATGEPLDWDGWLEVTVEPGEVVRIEAPEGPQPVDNHVPVRGGKAEGLTVYVSRAFSRARLWAEDVGFLPTEPSEASCSNGMDDDGDGRIDFPDDPGCRFANDDSEEPGSHAAGVSEELFFASPTLADVQGFQAESPLQGRRVSVERGLMIVTRVTTDGFYVSELELDDAGNPTGRARPWSSAFVFNFSTPPFLRACDRILRVGGGVVEFFGFTELSFPSWEREIWCPSGETCLTAGGRELEGGPCLIPEPFLLDESVLGTPAMEQFESHLVRIDDATVASQFGPQPPPEGSNCDIDGDGVVSLEPGIERDCNDRCSSEPSCSEWNQYVEFGQFVMQTAGAVINVVTRDSLPNFEPPEHRGETFSVVRGTLRHFAPLGPERGYILQPRCEGDIAEAGESIAPANESCVSPRTEGPVEPEG